MKSYFIIFVFLLFFFFTYSQSLMYLIYFFLQYSQSDLPPPQTTLCRGHGPRFEPGTGGSIVSVTLITRPQHLIVVSSEEDSTMKQSGLGMEEVIKSEEVTKSKKEGIWKLKRQNKDA